MLLHSKTKQRILHDFDLYLNDERLLIVDKYKYLGVIIDSNWTLKWSRYWALTLVVKGGRYGP